MYHNPDTKVSFLTPEENTILYHLLTAQKMFYELSTRSPQDPSDSYNFGHYIDAARNSVIMRGARRMDPETLLPKKDKEPSASAKIFGIKDE